MSQEQRSAKYATSFKEQFTVRGMIIGAVGAIILTMSSMFVALKLGALPWPIMFVALVSMFALKALGNTNINEINVTHTAMSAGAMVAGGLAFTLPGIWMLDANAEVSSVALVVITLGGVILGLIFTALIRKYFIEIKELPYPMGQAAAETLIVGDEGGKKAGTLFASLGVAALFTVLRDWFGTFGAGVVWFKKMMPYGSLGGMWLSLMLVAVGFIIGPVFIGVWFLGAIIGDFGILIGGQMAGLWDAATAASIKSSLGIGLMVGTGIGIIVKGILPKAKEIFGPMFSKSGVGSGMVSLRWAPIVMVILAFVFTILADMGVVASICTIIGVWLATAMSSQCVGQSGINPMEIFGIIVLIATKAVSSIGQTEAFFVAAIVAVACGLVGDVMNDFKAGYILKSDPKAQWLGEVIGGIITSSPFSVSMNSAKRTSRPWPAPARSSDSCRSPSTSPSSSPASRVWTPRWIRPSIPSSVCATARATRFLKVPSCTSAPSRMPRPRPRRCGPEPQIQEKHPRPCFGGALCFFSSFGL